MSEKDLDPAEEIDTLSKQVSALFTAAEAMQRQLDVLKDQIQDPKKKRHLWLVPGVLGGAATASFNAIKKNPGKSAASVAAAGVAAMGLYAVAPDHRPEPPGLPGHAAPWKPDYRTPKKGEVRQQQPESGDRQPHESVPGGEVQPVMDKSHGEPVTRPEDPDPEEPTTPPGAPSMSELQSPCLLKARVTLIGTRVIVSLCTSA